MTLELSSASWFLLVAGNGRIRVHELRRDELVIGRSPECDVVIDDQAFSRKHATLRLTPPITIEDLGSKNGVEVQGQRVQAGEPFVLPPDHGFRIGPYTCVLVARNANTPTTSQPSAEEAQNVDDPTVEGVGRFVRDVAKSELSVLILGETGVGKEVLASTIHRLSERSGPLSSINCAALSEFLLESELFGHERGAFTGATSTKIGLLEASENGSVFLDEIGELPLSAQAKLLRAVEAREVFRLGSTTPIRFRVRFIAASNRDLAAEVAAGRFRADLYFRLAGVTFSIPPLRSRRHAITTLALLFFREAARRENAGDPSITPEVLAALEAHDWPGNVRELKAIVERAYIIARGRPIAMKHLVFDKLERGGANPEATAGMLSSDEREDRELILRTLEECAGNQTRTAKALGISRTTLIQKLKLYRIPRPRA